MLYCWGLEELLFVRSQTSSPGCSLKRSHQGTETGRNKEDERWVCTIHKVLSLTIWVCFFTCSRLSGMSIVQYERKAAKLHNKPTKITMHTSRCKRWQLDCEMLIFILGSRIIPALHEKWLTSINWFNCSAVKWARAENIDFKNFFQIRFETVYRAGETSDCRLGLQGGSVWIQQIQIPRSPCACMDSLQILHRHAYYINRWA